MEAIEIYMNSQVVHGDLRCQDCQGSRSVMQLDILLKNSVLSTGKTVIRNTIGHLRSLLGIAVAKKQKQNKKQSMQKNSSLAC